MKIYFVCHAESESSTYYIRESDNASTKTVQRNVNRHGDPGITALGRAQAISTALELKKTVDPEKPVHVFISPFERTYLTAVPFCDQIDESKLEIFMSDALQEYTSPDKKLDSAALEKGIVVDKTWKSFTERVVQFIKVIKNSTDSQIYIFGHSTFLSVMIQRLLANEKYLPSSKNVALNVSDCSITCFEYSKDETRWIFHLVGSQAHLGNLHSIK